MARKYEALKPARFHRAVVDGVEKVVIPARRNWFVLLFLSFWLAVWTVGGAFAVNELTQTFDMFLLFWLFGWAIGWLFAASVVAWQINGRETLQVTGGDLEVRHSAIGVSKSWWFRGNEIRDLKASDQPAFPFGWGAFDGPLMFWRRSGAVKFRYGARTIYLAPSLDEPEGELIVDSLSKHLPRAVKQ